MIIGVRLDLVESRPGLSFFVAWLGLARDPCQFSRVAASIVPSKLSPPSTIASSVPLDAQDDQCALTARTLPVHAIAAQRIGHAMTATATAAQFGAGDGNDLIPQS